VNPAADPGAPGRIIEKPLDWGACIF